MQAGSSAIGPSSLPASLTTHFLELYGETEPQVDSNYAQVLADRGKDTAGPIYEYFWTLGRYERPPEEDGRQADLQQSREIPAKPCCGGSSTFMGPLVPPVATGVNSPVAASRRCTCCSRGAAAGVCTRSRPQ